MKKQIDEKILIDLYITQNLPRKEVARICGISDMSIKRMLKIYKIKKSKEQILESNRNYYKSHDGKTVGKKWYNNGKIQTLAIQCPDGFVEGRLEKTKERQSKSLMGHITNDDTKIKIGNANRGYKHTGEAKQKIGDFMRKTHPLKGTHRSKETKEKLIRRNLKMEDYKKDQYFNKQFWINNFVKDDHFDRRAAKEYFGCQYYVLREQMFRLELKYPDVQYPDNTSIVEEEIREFVRSFGFTAEKGRIKIDENIIEDPDNTNYYEIDVYIPELKVGIEYNGVYFHSYPTQPKSYHFNKSKLCKEKGIRLIHVWEDQWLDERLNPIIKSIIKAALKIPSEEKPIYARKCVIKELDPKTYKEYCDKNHTQLSRPAQIRLGLFYNDELVQLASFSQYKGRNGKKSEKAEEKYDWEFVRGCESFNHSRVIGGVSKLFTHFVRNYNPQNVLCYSDFNFFCGNGYAASGFDLDGYTGADKFYVDKKTMKRINRSASKYKEYMQHVKDGDWYLCYGAGSLRFIWKKKDEETL